MDTRLFASCLALGSSLVACNGDPAPSPATDAGADTPAPGDAAADGGDPWACLGRVTPVAPGGTMVTIALRAVAVSDGRPLPGLTAKACGRSDVTCATPYSMGTTDATGGATLTGPVGAQGFDGYIELTGGAGGDEIVPTKMYPNPPLAAGMRPVTSRLVERSSFALLGTALAARLDAMNGMITAAVSDCNRAPAQGATLAAMPAPMGARQFYTTAAGLPSTMATETGAAGSGGFVNVPPGDYTLTASRVTPAARIGAATVNVRGGFITSINVAPSP